MLIVKILKVKILKVIINNDDYDINRWIIGE